MELETGNPFAIETITQSSNAKGLRFGGFEASWRDVEMTHSCIFVLYGRLVQ